ncbi:hypothetical protein OGAPHI_000185 [Ogataea philodendri]|uniref:Aminotransferase n=1 Tax=Ogataea philodendri TaxID=1378263 RepID=A0A9P8PFV3_9ASCO|nr:uncharacterized protein OGAPHI_000185 [Ogataea philodendri]KAH3671483.1 hypothetical protein OGAPHI_000185 [Ogataea philodendri]
MTSESQKTDSILFQHNVTERGLMSVGGKGSYLYIEDPITGERKTVIDGSTGAAIGSLGHGDEDIAAEFAAAGKECAYSFHVYVSNYYAEKLAEFIINRSPEGAFSSALFVCSGSEANEHIMRISRQYFLEKGEPKRIKFISRNQSYHGFTAGALALTGQKKFDDYKAIAMPSTQILKTSVANPYRGMKEGETEKEYKNRLLAELEQTFLEADPSTVAGVFIETVSGSSLACQTPLPGYLEGAREIIHKHGALFISDEVMSGLGRCGTYHAWEQYLPKDKGPDLQSIGKTLGSGFVTIAGVLVSPKVKKVIAEGSKFTMGAQSFHGHVFNCRIALAVQKKIKEKKLVENSREVGDYLGKLLQDRLGDHKYVGCIKGAGLFRGIEFVQDKSTKQTFPHKINFGARFGDLCLKNGLTVMGGSGVADGYQGDQALLCPAYITTKELADSIVDILERSLNEITAEVDTDLET